VGCARLVEEGDGHLRTARGLAVRSALDCIVPRRLSCILVTSPRALVSYDASFGYGAYARVLLRLEHGARAVRHAAHARGPAAARECPERAHVVLFDLRLRDACGRDVAGAEARRRWPSRSRKEARRLTRGLSRFARDPNETCTMPEQAVALPRPWNDLAPSLQGLVQDGSRR
jgi:hypothetical protein